MITENGRSPVRAERRTSAVSANPVQVPWHTQELRDVLARLGVTPEQGLPVRIVRERQANYGRNVLVSERAAPWLTILARQLASPLVYLLIIAAGITLAIREFTDAAVISAAVLLNVGIGFYQEFHAGNIFASLKKRITTAAFVVRDGATHQVDAGDLVPGDIVLLKTGAKVPADIRLVSCDNLSLDESLLTGESTAVEKQVGVLDVNTPLADRANMAFMGTTVSYGTAVGVTVGTGLRTQVGRVVQLTEQVPDEQTPLQRRIAALGKVLVTVSVVATALIFTVGLLEDRSPVEMLITAVAVAVAAIPEGLPAVLSVVLAVGAKRIYRRQGLIRKLIAAETLGSTTVICADKTGTLTEGKMRIEKLSLVSEQARERAIYALGLANEATLDVTPRGTEIRGDTTDQAKMRFFLDQGYSLSDVARRTPRIALMPFDSSRMYVAAFHVEEDGASVYVTGAPESLLYRTNLTDQEQHELREEADVLARRGFRIIGIAYRRLTGGEVPMGDTSHATLRPFVSCLTYLGFAAIRDPLRPDVQETIGETRRAGVRVVMVTGDHRLTAEAIGRELGFETGAGRVMEGRELDTLGSAELTERVADVSIFARVTPEHKLRIVSAWRSRGEAVTMTGDGVNDTPSLKAADIGVALGSGTDIAKDASELVLLNDSFSTIAAAIREGRIAYDNMRKAVVFLLNGSFTEILLILTGIVLNVPLPFTAIQILWINLIEDGLPNFALAFERGERDVMDRPPLPRSARLLDPLTASLIFGAGLVGDLILVGLFISFMGSGVPLDIVQTFFVAAVGSDALFSVFALKSMRLPLYRINPLNNLYLLIAVTVGLAVMIASVYSPQLNALLATAPLPASYLGLIAGYLVVRIASLELVKAHFRRKTS